MSWVTSWAVEWFAGSIIPAVAVVLTPFVMEGIKWLIREFDARVPRALIPPLLPVIGGLIDAAIRTLASVQFPQGGKYALVVMAIGALSNWLHQLAKEWAEYAEAKRAGEPPAAI
jgi:hypothetical protein